jgi:hypothetical protein
MNVRFSDRHIRFRVTRLELDRLLAGRALTLDVPLPRSHTFRANISMSALGGWQLDSDPTGMWLTLPRSEIESLLSALPSKEGLEHQFDTNGTALTVAFEVDLKKEREKRAA